MSSSPLQLFQQKYLTASFYFFARFTSLCALTLDSASSSVVVLQIFTLTICHISICLSRFFFPTLSPQETSIWQINQVLHENSTLDTPLLLSCVCLAIQRVCMSVLRDVCHNDYHCCAAHCLHEFVAYKHILS